MLLSTTYLYEPGRPASSQAVSLPRRPRTRSVSGPRRASPLGVVSTLTQAVSGYEYRSCHYVVSLWLRVSYGHEDSLVQCLAQFIRMWHWDRGKACYLWLPCINVKTFK